ncbi:MAG: riboflavin synthase [Sphingobacteriales bacterium]|nr:MAG: riboflavin synthase [Sphingobacteriales bacterium]
MFSGIIKDLGEIISVEKNGTNISFWIKSNLLNEISVDQSIAHNGVCLTVETIREDAYRVTAIEETLQKTNLKHFSAGAYMNLEFCLRLNSLLDGHIVQGHVDTTAICTNIENRDGSTIFTFNYPEEFYHLLVEKGSICVNGVSLTAYNTSTKNAFSVAIIPYTLQHTTFQFLKVGDEVNIEFDILGKYFARWMEKYKPL